MGPGGRVLGLWSLLGEVLRMSIPFMPRERSFIWGAVWERGRMPGDGGPGGPGGSWFVN